MPLPPTRCFSCGRVLGDKYHAYLKKVKELGGDDQPGVYYYFNAGGARKSAHALALDALDINSGCCRTYMLTQPRS